MDLREKIKRLQNNNDINIQNEYLEEQKKQINSLTIRLNNVHDSIFRNDQKSYVEQLLEKLYREILIRIPDEQAKMHYLPRLINKEISEEDLRKILLQSEEAKNIRQNFGL